MSYYLRDAINQKMVVSSIDVGTEDGPSPLYGDVFV